jgi:hypothetical protein
LSVASGHDGGVAEVIDRVAVAGTVIAVLERNSSITCGTCHVYCENCHYRGGKTDSTHRIPPIVNSQEFVTAQVPPGKKTVDAGIVA